MAYLNGRGIVDGDSPDAMPLFPMDSSAGDGEFLEPGEMAVLAGDGVAGQVPVVNAIEKPLRQATPEYELIDKVGYRHVMLKEIGEQPKILLGGMGPESNQITVCA